MKFDEEYLPGDMVTLDLDIWSAIEGGLPGGCLLLFECPAGSESKRGMNEVGRFGLNEVGLVLSTFDAHIPHPHHRGKSILVVSSRGIVGWSTDTFFRKVT
jgi:hypothetical protein